MRILVVNAGSSSLKLRVLDPDDRVVGAEDLPAPRGQADIVAVARAIAGFGAVDAVGHRIVHGGTLYARPVRIDRVPELGPRAAHVRQLMVDRRLRARAYTRLEGEDAPEIRTWSWPH